MPIDPEDGIVVAENRSRVTPPSDDEGPEAPARSRWLIVATSIVVPAALAIGLVSLLAGERARVDVDLQLQTTAQAKPGATLPVRGLFYTGLSAIEGPRLTRTEASIELIDVAHRVLATRKMQIGIGETLEANLPLDAGIRGPLRVRLSARDGGSTIAVEQSCIVSEGAGTLTALPRALRPLQQLAAGPLRREGDALPPAALDLQVIGGACAPEQPCEVLIHVGEPAAAIAIEPYAALDVVVAPPAVASADIVHATVRVHGPEAELRIVASIAGAVVARRTFRLPVAQAMWPLVLASVVDRAKPPAITRAGTRDACVVDLFRDERWEQTATLPACDRIPLPKPLRPGLWRIQTRDDPFGGDAAATRLWIVRDAESDAEVLQRLAHLVGNARRDDRMARRVSERAATFATRDFAGYSAWLLASLEDRLVTLPSTVSSYPLALNALEQKRARLRMFCLAALLLSAIAAVSLIARRGLRASARARDIMEDAGDPDAQSRARRARMTFTVIASAASIAVAFLAIALYVIARG